MSGLPSSCLPFLICLSRVSRLRHHVFCIWMLTYIEIQIDIHLPGLLSIVVINYDKHAPKIQINNQKQDEYDQPVNRRFTFVTLKKTRLPLLTISTSGPGSWYLGGAHQVVTSPSNFAASCQIVEIGTQQMLQEVVSYLISLLPNWLHHNELIKS